MPKPPECLTKATIQAALFMDHPSSKEFKGVEIIGKYGLQLKAKQNEKRQITILKENNINNVKFMWNLRDFHLEVINGGIYNGKHNVLEAGRYLMLLVNTSVWEIHMWRQWALSNIETLQKQIIDNNDVSTMRILEIPLFCTFKTDWNLTLPPISSWSTAWIIFCPIFVELRRMQKLVSALLNLHRRIKI